MRMCIIDFIFHAEIHTLHFKCSAFPCANYEERRELVLSVKSQRDTHPSSDNTLFENDKLYVVFKLNLKFKL